MGKKSAGHNIIANAQERQKLKAMLAEATHCFERIDDEREQVKTIISDAAEQFGVDKKVLNKIAKMMYKHNYADYKAEQEHFEILYETLVEGLTVVDKAA
jgi:hypothetical protein